MLHNYKCSIILRNNWAIINALPIKIRVCFVRRFSLQLFIIVWNFVKIIIDDERSTFRSSDYYNEINIKFLLCSFKNHNVLFEHFLYIFASFYYLSLLKEIDDKRVNVHVSIYSLLEFFFFIHTTIKMLDRTLFE